METEKYIVTCDLNQTEPLVRFQKLSAYVESVDRLLSSTNSDVLWPSFGIYNNIEDAIETVAGLGKLWHLKNKNKA